MLFFVISKPAFSQELIATKVSKQQSTTWDFICENYVLTGIAKVQVIKTDKGGTLKLAIETNDPTFIISGTVYIYLADSSIIICSDKGIRENMGNQIISYYSFSALEMNKLKKTDIQSLRFNINGTRKKFSSQIGNFTALNKQKYFVTANDSSKKNFDTAQEIASLYK
ncbi:hypothetical protein [Flavobacterium sp.]|uniref:hypothetical protein n=1 Tax=Flavobacterium sp. TaxID=239 RepID=UPI0037B0AC79